mgnify:CR=1 FL=1
MDARDRRCDKCNQRGAWCEMKKAGAIKIVCNKCAVQLKNNGWIRIEPTTA